MCDCGCNTCETKSTLMLNESLAPRAILSEGLKYHMDANKPLTEHLYRAGSDNYFNLWAEARSLYSREILEITHEDDLAVLTETDLGHYGMFEGRKVPLDFPIELNEQKAIITFKNDYEVKMNTGEGYDDDFEYFEAGEREQVYILNKNDKRTHVEFGDGTNAFIPSDIISVQEKSLNEDEQLDEKKKAKKNNKKLNKPMRDSSGGKAYKVYVKDPKTKKIKTVRFGSGGLRAKINDKKARNAFAARHKCSTKKDKTKAGYWSCRLPRYAKLLGLKSNFGGFW